MEIAEAFVEIHAKLDKFEQELQDSAQRSGAKAGQTLASNIAQVFAAGAFLKGMKDSIDAASGLNEQVNQTSLIFPTAKAAIDDYAKNSAEKFGLSERAFREATSGLGGLLQNLGYTEQAAVDASVNLTQMASDLGSAFNKDPADAVAAIGSALRGEAEPIRQFNVIIDDARVKAKAFEMGLYSGKGAIEQNAKAQATLALITEQTSKVQGDFANTIDGAANAERVAAAQREDSAASMGKSFLPIYERAVKLVGQLAEVFGSLPAPIQTAVVALLGLVALAGPISKTVGLLKDIRKSFQESAASGGGLSKTMKGAGLAFAGLAVGMAAWEIHASRVKQHQQDMIEGFNELSRVEDAQVLRTLTQAFLDAVLAGEDMEDMMTELVQTNIEGARRALELAEAKVASGEASDTERAMVEELTKAIDAEEAARAQAARTTAEHAKAETDAGEQVGTTRGEMMRATRIYGEYAEAMKGATAETEDVAKATSHASDSVENLSSWQEHSKDAAEAFALQVGELRDEIENLTSALDIVIGRNMDLENANQALYEGTNAITESFKENGKTLDIATEAGRKNRDVVAEQVQNILAHGKAMIEQGQSQEDATAAIELGRQALIEQMTQLGLTKEEAEAYVDQLGLTPENIVTSVAIANTEQMKREIADIIERLGPIDDPREAKIQALMDQGKYEEALAMLRALERTLKPSIQPVNAYSVSSGTVYKSAAGRFVPGGSNILSTLGEQGSEVVLPLSDPSRIEQLLADPRVGGPIAAALGGDGASVMSGASPLVGVMNFHRTTLSVDDINRALLMAKLSR